MKKKLLALFLCCVMVFSLVPVALTSAFATGNGFQIYSSNGTVAETVLLQMSKKMDLTAVAETGSGNYQWQIRVSGDVWANIVGTNGNTLELSYGLVANALDNDAAEIRCKLTNDVGNVSYSNIVTVQIQPNSTVRRAPAASPAVGTVISEAQPIGEPVIVPADAPSYYNAPAANSEPVVNDTPTDSGESNTDAEPAPVSNDEAADGNDDSVLPGDSVPVNDPALVNDTPANDVPADETPANDTPTNDTPTPTTYAILINYQFTDGRQAAPSWSATVATGSTYTQDIQSPVVVGYTPDQPVVHVEASEAKIYTVTYQAAEVDFTVKHYQQNVSNDEYTLADTETKKGFTESAVGAGLAKTDYTGFYSLLYDTTTKIAADGSTVVEVYYDRYYYLMNFDLDGGYGVEPIYARYGAPISVDTPTKPGYTFTGWDKAIPKTMPVDGGTYKATWKIGESGFTVVFWYENADDDGYSVAGTYTPADVAPGTQKKSEDYKDQSFTGRDDKHFTYNAAKAEIVTVKGDGSTVLNAYYTRNTYTLKFVDGTEEVLSCGKEDHTHSYTGKYKKGGFIGIGATTYYYGGCYPAGGKDWGGGTEGNTICGKEEHTHNWRCYSEQPKVVKEITAKYQADIHGNFPIKDGNDTIWWKVPQGTETYGNSDEQRYLGSIDTMPGENITFEKYDTESGAKIYYYVETLNGEQGDTTYNGRTYKQYKVIDLEYSSSVNLTYAEEFHPITGFTQGDSNPKLPVGGQVRMKETNYLYYTRNSYNLKFYNYNAYVDGKGGSVQYEAPLSGYYFEPEYPANLEKNAYVFDGWYTTAGCYEGSKADLNTMTMPASDVILYAKWVPKTHTVKTYLTKDVLDNSGNPMKTWAAVPHGTAVKDPPEDPTRDPYKFVGWFYISDTGEEKAFDFSMPVNRDLNLYAKWSSNTLMTYTIRYQLADGTEIATPTKGSALAGTTRTFDAKTGTQLYDDYQSGYFPQTSSHSLTIDIEGTAENGKNEFIFVYVPKAEVNYTVRYLEKDTNTVLHDEKQAATRDAVITEKFVQINGYAPDAYQKRLVLSADEGQNVITFWYVKDNDHAPVQIIHWTQNIEGDGYTEYSSSTDLNGIIGTMYTETPLELRGFQYNGTKSNASGTLSAEGLVLNLYYDRIEYPYEFRFLEQGTEKKLAEPATGSARYMAQVTQAAKTIPGYKLVSGIPDNQDVRIAIEDPANVASKNVKTFYYVEDTVNIKYEMVGPTGSGTLDNYQDNGIGVLTGKIANTEDSLKGSAPTAADGFKFVGWFKDAACEEPVDETWVVNNKLTPDKTKNYGTDTNPAMGYEAATYYAKFEYDVANLTISKQGCENIDENQSFLFDVTGPNGYSTRVVINGNGSVIIKGLKIGEYTVTEVTSWSWRYDAESSSQSIKLQPAQTNAVNFVNSRSNHKWLGGDAYSNNVFGSIFNQ